MVLSIAGMHPRSLSFKILILGATLTFLLFLYIYTTPAFLSPILSDSISDSTIISDLTKAAGRCLPSAYARGRWTGPHTHTNSNRMMNKSQALEFAGFEGCASSREFDWHLASDTEEQWDRFPAAQSYRWDVGKAEGCEGLEKLDKERMVRDLVEQGGWLLLGDSITEGHFFSLSCTLYPHVIATPTYTPNSYFDRAWPQNLYLNPDSPLLRPSSKQLYLPPGFNVSSTPLVTFRRIDLLLTQPELVGLHRSLHPNANANFSLFSEEATWSMSPSEYMPLFFAGKYSTMIVNTGGHWTTTLFGGYGDKGEESTHTLEDAKQGIDGVIEFFGEAMRLWAGQVQDALDVVARQEGQGQKRRQILVRAYLPGHEDCHKSREPWTEIQPFNWGWYNWGRIWEFNYVFEGILTASPKKYSNIHYLAIDRPGRLRPDAHATGDCLHIMAGAGVLEGWSHYIWHYVTKELGRR